MKTTIDAEAIERMAEIGCTDAEISHITGITPSTLKRRHRQALDRGRAKLREGLRRKQIELATKGKGNATMLIWLGKQYLGQKDRQEVTHGERVEIVEEVVFPKDSTSDGENNHPAHPAATRL